MPVFVRVYWMQDLSAIRLQGPMEESQWMYLVLKEIALRLRTDVLVTLISTLEVDLFISLSHTTGIVWQVRLDQILLSA